MLFLVRLSRRMERIEEFESWHCTPTRIVPRQAGSGIMCDYCILGARIAIHDRRHQLARRFIDQARECAQARANLPRMLLMACEIELRLATGEDACSDSELSDLISLHARARNLGGQDEVVTALLRALSSRGRPRNAASVLDNYLRNRRNDGLPLRSQLD